MTLRLAGRVAIVTGGGHGIGKAYAHRFAEEGAKVVVAEQDGEAAQAVERDLRRRNLEALGLRTDVADEASVNDMAARAISAFGRIDILVNNAAVFATVPMSRVPFDQIAPAEWDKLM